MTSKKNEKNGKFQENLGLSFDYSIHSSWLIGNVSRKEGVKKSKHDPTSKKPDKKLSMNYKHTRILSKVTFTIFWE